MRQSVQTALRNLRTDYIDSFVLHSPQQRFEDTMRVWGVVEEFIQSGVVKQGGVSNCYDLSMFKRICEAARHKPRVLQNRFYADSGYDVDLRAYCLREGVEYQSFWTLSANGRALGSAPLKAAAAARRWTPEQLLYRYMMDSGCCPLTGTCSAEHMAQDMAVLQGPALTAAELAPISAFLRP